MLTCAIKFSEYGVNNININLSLSQMIKSLVVKTMGLDSNSTYTKKEIY